MVTDLYDGNPYFAVLKNNPLFETATNQSIISLVENCKMKCFSKGVDSIDNDKNLYNFYFIISGKIKVFNYNNSDKSLTLFILSKNDVFDIFTLINNHQHNVSYEILENVKLLVIPVGLMREWLKKNPNILNSFFKYTIYKFELLESHILDIGTNGLTARLANLLLHYYNSNTCHIEDICDLSHNELAQLVGTSRAVFNRAIQKFKKEGVLKITRKNIEILNLPELIKYSQA